MGGTLDEFFKVLHCDQYMHVHKKMKTSSGSEFPLGSTIDQDKKLVLLGKVVAAVALAKVVAKKLGFVAWYVKIINKYVTDPFDWVPVK